jgi:hypothetical protein
MNSSLFERPLDTIAAFSLLLFRGVMLISLYRWLLFQRLVELFSIATAFSIFVIARNTRDFMDNRYLLIPGIAYLFTAGIVVLLLDRGGTGEKQPGAMHTRPGKYPATCI